MLVISHMRSKELTTVNMYDMNSVFNTKQAELKEISSGNFRKNYENNLGVLYIK